MIAECPQIKREAWIDHLLSYVCRCVGQHRMVLVGVHHHVVLFAGAVERPGHLDGVLEMDVIVGRAVDDQQPRAPVVEHPREIDRRIVVVACGVVLRQVVVDFGVNRVVVAPRSDGSHGDRSRAATPSFRCATCAVRSAGVPSVPRCVPMKNTARMPSC